MRWWDLAACTEADAELFTPPGSTWEGHKKQVHAAKKICKQCPVIEQCLEHALATREPFAIMGGTTPGQRRHIRHTRREAS